MVAVASDLLWQLVRNNSCFLKKQVNLPVMTAEPNNVSGVNSFKYSGLANTKSVGITSSLKGKKQQVVLTTGVKKNASKPCKAQLPTGVSKCAKKGAAQLEKALAGSCFRRDMVAAAQKKYSVLLKSFKKAKKQAATKRVAEKAALKKKANTDEEVD